ncbi:MAG: hypothetical protein PVH12_05805 [Candidatus Bathyarchaeota archaeon]|jgi:hypothetical protein
MFNDTESLFEDFPQTGYSISVVQTPEGTKVKAKVGKNTDANLIKKQLQEQYPDSKIEIEGGKTIPLIREISTKTLKPGDKKRENKKGRK